MRLLIIVLGLYGLPAVAQSVHAGQVWWSLSQHEAREIVGVGECSELHQQLRDRWLESRAQGEEVASDERERSMLIEVASKSAPLVVAGTDSLPAGECVAFGHYTTPTVSGQQLRVYKASFEALDRFRDGHVLLGGR